MKNKKTIKNIVIALVVAILLLGIYAAVIGQDENSTGGTSSLSSLVGSGNFGEVQESNTDLANAEILRILGSIQNINLDDDIFKNPVFRELEDSRFTIPKPIVIGRPNPFLPIGFDGLAQTNVVTNDIQNSFVTTSEVAIDNTATENSTGFFNQ